MMRDPQRIPAVLEALRLAWERNPDWRLGQLIYNTARPAEPCCALFYLEDDALLALLQQTAQIAFKSVER